MLKSFTTAFFIILSSIIILAYIGNIVGVFAQISSDVVPINITTTSDSSLNNLYNKVKDSVVQITTEYEDPNYPAGLYDSTGSTPYPMKFGSGFVYDDSGIIITNYHVVSSATNIVVTFNNGNSYTAKVVGVDPYGDISILKTDNSTSEKFVPVTFSNSSDVKIGDQVYAIGYPNGLENSLTFGIVSQIGSLLANSDLGYSIPNPIQTFPNLTPIGNAGSPLINSEGNVVGMNTAFFAQNQSASGDFGFAIPSNDIMRVIPSLIKTGFYDHAWLGISGSKLSPILAEVFGLPSNYKGVLIEDVVPNGPADKAGLKGMLIQGNKYGEQQITDKDIVTKIDGIAVSNMGDIISLVDTYNVGENITMTVNRNGNILNLTATLISRPELSLTQSQSDPNAAPSELPDFNFPNLNDSNMPRDQNPEGQNEVSIIEGSNFREGNNLYIIGEVKNNLNSILNLVEVSITLYDINDNIIGTTLTYTNPSTIQPLESAPFKLSIGPSDVTDINAIDEWKIVASYY
jgi:S1-C subfamily serine protease